MRALRNDPYLQANTRLSDRLARAAWNAVWLVLFRPSPRPLHAWRRFLLRLFGARVGRGCRIYPGARIWAPWNLDCDDVVGIADGAEIYNPSRVRLGSHATVSQQAYLCGASHDLGDPAFPMISRPIEVGRYAWLCARSTVQMGVRVGDGAVLGLGGIATRDLEPWTVYAGAPARALRLRPRPDASRDAH